MKSRQTNPRVSLVCATGSTEINTELRAELLWRMVNSAHEDPGYPFELVIVDNCHGPGPHREAVRQIADTYRTVTHVVQNRLNEYHGGGIRQGLMVADGDLFVAITDDLELRPRWLEALLAPLREDPRERLIGALLPGHNSSGKQLNKFELRDRQYTTRTSAAAYCWAFWDQVLEVLGEWRRGHYADTRWSRKAQAERYRFVLPVQRFAVETNLNFLRPWDYAAEKDLRAKENKHQYLDRVWENVGLLAADPEVPREDRPLRNPGGVGPVENGYEKWVANQKRRLGWLS